METSTEIKLEPMLSAQPTISDPISYYTAKAEEIFDMFDIDGTYSDVGVRKNISTWYDNKSGLMDLFRKHPYWNEEAKAILFLRDETRPVDYQKARYEFNALLQYVENEYESYRSNRIDKFVDVFRNCLRFYKSPTLTEEGVADFKKYCTDLPKHLSSHVRVGVKLTKIVQALFKEFEYGDNDSITVVNATRLVDSHDAGDRTYDSYDKHFARFADCLSELTVKKITVMSVHFNDFMTMSNGNSWSSCHFINSNGIFHEDAEQSYHGMYKQGCLSYALDAPSFIFYTLPDRYNGNEYCKQPKLNRMCCQYRKGIIVTGKCYPDNNEKTIDTYRCIIEQVISQCEGFANSWSFSRNMSRIESFVKTANNAGHYADYFYEGQRPTIALHKPLVIDDIDDTMEIGHAAYCLECGEELNGPEEHEWLQCRKHRHKRICAHCGRVIERDEEVHEYEDEIYCSDCVFFCKFHNRFEPINYRAEIELTNGTIAVCRFAKEYEYKQCEVCGKWYLCGNFANMDGHLICNNCFAAGYKICPHCGTLVSREEDVSEGCNVCKKIRDIGLLPTLEYEIGDYVVLQDDIKNCRCAFGYNDEMCSRSGMIVKITNKMWASSHNTMKYYITDGTRCEIRWMWDRKCIMGKIIAPCDDSMLGKIFKEVQ